MMNNSIKTVLFDLDDTLLETSKVFDKRIIEFNQELSRISGVTYEALNESFNRHLIDAYHQYAVNYNNYWPYTIDHVLEEFKIDHMYKPQLFDLVMQIYREVPRVVSGARIGLERLKNTGIKLGLVTHASPEWTKFKVEGSRLNRYFDHIEIVDQNKFKGVEDWNKALVHLNANPEETAVVGDNVKGDILAGHELGIKKLVWRKLRNGWKVYTEGELPSTVITIKDLRGIDKLILT